MERKITVNPEIINFLNEALKNEFISIKQWKLDAFNLKYQGFKELSKLFLEYAVDEIEHQELIINRIYTLGGRPSFMETKELFITDDIKQILNYELELENDGIELLKKAINLAQNEFDFVTADMLTNILTDEEEHKIFLETQFRLMNKVTEINYLATMIEESK